MYVAPLSSVPDFPSTVHLRSRRLFVIYSLTPLISTAVFLVPSSCLPLGITRRFAFVLSTCHYHYPTLLLSYPSRQTSSHTDLLSFDIISFSIPTPSIPAIRYAWLSRQVAPAFRDRYEKCHHFREANLERRYEILASLNQIFYQRDRFLFECICYYSVDYSSPRGEPITRS